MKKKLPPKHAESGLRRVVEQAIGEYAIQPKAHGFIIPAVSDYLIEKMFKGQPEKVWEAKMLEAKGFKLDAIESEMKHRGNISLGSWREVLEFIANEGPKIYGSKSVGEQQKKTLLESSRNAAGILKKIKGEPASARASIPNVDEVLRLAKGIYSAKRAGLMGERNKSYAKSMGVATKIVRARIKSVRN